MTGVKYIIKAMDVNMSVELIKGGYKMGVLSNIEPYEVFRFFEEICGIPHGSSDTKRISDYLVKFAADRDLRYIQDDSNNVIIFKDGTAGYENSAPVMLQGHMDMVCEKDADFDIDF